MKKIVIISVFFSIHFSVCMAQVTCKTVYDKESSGFKMTITNLYEDRSVILISNSEKAKETEIVKSFSGEKKIRSIDGNKLLEITLFFYEENENMLRNILVRVSDKKLQENAIAPLDSVTCTYYYLDPEEKNMFHKVRVSVSIPYSTVDGDIWGLYDNCEYIYLSPQEE